MASNSFRKRYFQNRKKIPKKFQRIQKNKRIHLLQKRKILPFSLFIVPMFTRVNGRDIFDVVDYFLYFFLHREIVKCLWIQIFASL